MLLLIAWQARSALEVNEESKAQQRQEEKKKEEQRAAVRLNHAQKRAGTSPQGGTAADFRDNSSLEEYRTRNASLLHHVSTAPAVSGPPAKPRDAQGEIPQHAEGQDSEKEQKHHQGNGGLRGEKAEGAGGEDQEGSDGARETRAGDSRGQESNDVAFVLRKLYTGGGLDAQQQGWKCMPTNLFNTLTLQLGTLSKVVFGRK